MADYDVSRGGRLIGTLTRTGVDFPWHHGTFEPAAAFESVRPLFDRERALLEGDRMEEWTAAWDAIAKPGLWLADRRDGPGIAELLVHFEGSHARWRT